MEANLDGFKVIVKDNVEGLLQKIGRRWQISDWKILDVAEIFNSLPTFYPVRVEAQKCLS